MTSAHVVVPDLFAHCHIVMAHLAVFKTFLPASHDRASGYIDVVVSTTDFEIIVLFGLGASQRRTFAPSDSFMNYQTDLGLLTG